MLQHIYAILARFNKIQDHFRLLMQLEIKFTTSCYNIFNASSVILLHFDSLMTVGLMLQQS